MQCAVSYVTLHRILATLVLTRARHATSLVKQKILCHIVGLYSSTCLTRKSFVLLTRYLDTVKL